MVIYYSSSLKHNPCNPHQFLHFRPTVVHGTSGIFIVAESADGVAPGAVENAAPVEILAAGAGDLVRDGAEVNLTVNVGGHFDCLRE